MSGVMIFYSCARHFSNSTVRNAAMIKPPVPVFGVSGRYATALFSAASKEKKLDAVEKEVVTLQALIHQDRKFADFVLNPLTQRALKMDVISKALGKKNFGPITINFLGCMSENGRLRELDSVLTCFKSIMSSIRGEIPCTITTAKPLDAATKKEFEDTLKGFVKKNEKILLETLVDPAIIGGVVITIGDKYVDMSLSSKIKTYNTLLVQPF